MGAKVSYILLMFCVLFVSFKSNALDKLGFSKVFGYSPGSGILTNVDAINMRVTFETEFPLRDANGNYIGGVERSFWREMFQLNLPRKQIIALDREPVKPSSLSELWGQTEAEVSRVRTLSRGIKEAKPLNTFEFDNGLKVTALYQDLSTHKLKTNERGDRYLRLQGSIRLQMNGVYFEDSIDLGSSVLRQVFLIQKKFLILDVLSCGASSCSGGIAVYKVES